MKKFIPLQIVLVAVITLSFTNVFAQSTTNYAIEISSYAATKNTLPFWLTANKFGVVPNSSNGIVSTSVFKDFDKESNKPFLFSYKASFSSAVATDGQTIINELYAGFKYKNLQLIVGNKYNEVLWEGLSSSNGNILQSTNARAYPGIALKSANYFKLPFAKRWLTVSFSYADYILNDTRFNGTVNLHSKSLYFKSALSKKFSLITGLEHNVQWGGSSEEFGKQPSSFKDYLRVISGSSGGVDALEGDQINALGNTIGGYLLQLNYTGAKTNWNFYLSHPFEDRSGREFMNWSDNLYGVFIDFKKNKAFISHLVTEFTYTKNMSGGSPHGRTPDGVAFVASGRDNYFNNGIYQSGWTYFGNTIGSPYFTTKPVDENGITKGVIIGDNRFMAFNTGFKGYIKNIAYDAMFSYVTYFGWFGKEYSPRPIQFSGIFNVVLPTHKLPFKIAIGTAFDTGTYRPVNFGGYIKLIKTGVF